VVFLGYSDAMSIFLHDVEQHGREFSEQDATVVAVVPYGREEQAIPIESSSPFLVLYDKTHAVYRLSGAADEKGRPVPLVYLTDRFGEIVSTYVASSYSMSPKVAEILSTIDFVNRQCPECEPPEWPR
jgi:peroxiredoxin